MPSDHYHIWHAQRLNGVAPFTTRNFNVPRLSGGSTESKAFYSLKNDMNRLRADGKAKGIVDDTVVSVGKSWEGKELWALKVGNGDAHKVLFTGCHHSREWISVELPYLVAEYLINNYNPAPTTDKERRIKHLLDNRQIWFVPMVNPDGHDFSFRRNRSWRSNRKRHRVAAGTAVRSAADGGDVSWPAGNYRGVDVNRNYATSNWGTETFKGGFVRTSLDPRDGGENSIWCGPSASSEKESKAIDDLFQAHSFRASITYHNFHQLYLFPDAADADTFLKNVGNGMVTLINEHGNPYAFRKSSSLYPTSGTLMAFSYEKSPGRPTYTPELRPENPAPDPDHEFSGLPDAEIEPCFKENLAAALALINCAGHGSAPPPRTVCTWQLAIPPMRCQVVLNCWEVFRGWVP